MTDDIEDMIEELTPLFLTDKEAETIKENVTEHMTRIQKGLLGFFASITITAFANFLHSLDKNAPVSMLSFGIGMTTFGVVIIAFSLLYSKKRITKVERKSSIEKLAIIAEFEKRMGENIRKIVLKSNDTLASLTTTLNSTIKALNAKHINFDEVDNDIPNLPDEKNDNEDKDFTVIEVMDDYVFREDPRSIFDEEEL